MGIACMKEPSNALRVGYALQARVRCTPFDFNSSMIPSKPTPLPFYPDSTNKPGPRDRTCDRYHVRVQGNPFVGPKSLFDQMPTEIRHSLLSSDAIFNLSTFLGQLLLNSDISCTPSRNNAKKISLDHLFTISELACQFRLSELKRWSIEAVAAALNGPDSPLRTASNQIFVRALQLAFNYRLPDLLTSIQVKWLTRLHWKDLSPIPAILIADQLDLRNLLSHAYYTHMIEIDNIVEYCQSRGSSPLTLQQRIHLLAGYHSLAAYWISLRTAPPEFPKSPQCRSHEQCVAGWKMRWRAACSRSDPTPSADIFSRLRRVGSILQDDALVQACLSPGCRTSALGSISKKRTDISNNLHHHFDLS